MGKKPGKPVAAKLKPVGFSCSRGHKLVRVKVARLFGKGGRMIWTCPCPGAYSIGVQ